MNWEKYNIWYNYFIFSFWLIIIYIIQIHLRCCDKKNSIIYRKCICCTCVSRNWYIILLIVYMTLYIAFLSVHTKAATYSHNYKYINLCSHTMHDLYTPSICIVSCFSNLSMLMSQRGEPLGTILHCVQASHFTKSHKYL